MMHTPPIAPAAVFTEEWLTRAIGVVSEVIVLHGPQYAPLLDRLERELAEMKQRDDDPVSRARKHLAARSVAAHIPASSA